MVSFQDLPIPDSVKTSIETLGWTTPTPIQEQTIPLLLKGADLIGQAQTGTGKTGAFGIPAITSAIGRGRRGRLQVLVLVPTRELAVQVAKEINALGSGSDVRAHAVYGGVGMAQQEALLRKDRHAILVATPGRLLDHMGQGTADLRGIEMVILDEADRMLDMGFRRDMERILQAIPTPRQTVLFSATMPPEIEQLARRFLHDPQRVSVSEDSLSAPLAQKFVVHVAQEQKLSAVMHLLTAEKPERIILFRRTRGHVQRTLRKLSSQGVLAVGLHGDLSQNQRERSLSVFRDGTVRILVATDVAARGLDIPDVTHVVNVDCPNVAEAYVHRIGRTARAGRSGRTFLFVTDEDRADHRAIERLLGETLERFDMPVDLPYELPAPAHGGHDHHGQGHGRPAGDRPAGAWSDAARPRGPHDGARGPNRETRFRDSSRRPFRGPSPQGSGRYGANRGASRPHHGDGHRPSQPWGNNRGGPGRFSRESQGGNRSYGSHRGQGGSEPSGSRSGTWAPSGQRRRNRPSYR
ncbi:MAG: DEAD/DEAH box helicase [Thermoplasmatota archaeon]